MGRISSNCFWNGHRISKYLSYVCILHHNFGLNFFWNDISFSIYFRKFQNNKTMQRNLIVHGNFEFFFLLFNFRFSMQHISNNAFHIHFRWVFWDCIVPNCDSIYHLQKHLERKKLCPNIFDYNANSFFAWCRIKPKIVLQKNKCHNLSNWRIRNCYVFAHLLHVFL